MKPILELLGWCLSGIVFVCNAWGGSGPRLGSPEQLREQIRRLKSEDSAESRKALLQIAIAAEAHQGSAVYASSVYRAKLKDKAEAVVLLQSKHLEVREDALASMVGCTLNDKLWQELKKVLESGSAYQMGLIAAIAETDKALSAELKAADLVKSFERVEGALRATNLVWGSMKAQHTFAEIAYEHLTRCLMYMEGLDVRALTQLTPKAPGTLRDCVLIGRAYRGDSGVKEDLHRIVLNHGFPLIRSMAIPAVKQLGSQEDIAILERVAGTDPAFYQQWPQEPNSDGKFVKQTFYPLREEAIKALERMTNSARR